jgi:hypothetical protein
MSRLARGEAAEDRENRDAATTKGEISWTALQMRIYKSTPDNIHSEPLSGAPPILLRFTVPRI